MSVAIDAKTKRPIQVLDSLRRLRHDINYRGYQHSQADLDDILSIKEACWKPILDKVSEIIK